MGFFDKVKQKFGERRGIDTGDLKTPAIVSKVAGGTKTLFHKGFTGTIKEQKEQEGLLKKQGFTGVESSSPEFDKYYMSPANTKYQSTDEDEEDDKYGQPLSMQRLEIEKKYAVEKAKAVKQIEAEEARKMLLFKQQLEQEKRYGPGTFYIGGAKIPVLGKVSQARNWQVEQDIKRQSEEYKREAQRQQLERLRQQREQFQPRTQYNIGGSQSSYPQSPSLGWGMGLDINQGLNFGGGNPLGGQPQQQERDPMAMNMPIIAGLGGGFFGPAPQQEQVLPSQQVQQAQRVVYAQPVQRTREVPRGTYPVDKQFEGSVFRKVMMPYGPKYVKIDPSEAVPGERLYRRVKEPYGHKHVQIK